MAELNSLVKKKGHEVSEANRKVDDMVETLDCTWSVVQKSAGVGGGALLLSELDRECALSSKAHLLLAVNDEAAGTERRPERPEAENGTDLETRDTLPGFGSAHMFMPIPNSGTVVAAHCNWQFRYNYVENRIPRQ